MSIPSHEHSQSLKQDLRKHLPWAWAGLHSSPRQAPDSGLDAPSTAEQRHGQSDVRRPLLRHGNLHMVALPPWIAARHTRVQRPCSVCVRVGARRWVTGRWCRMVKHAPDMVVSVALLDPIVMLLNMRSRPRARPSTLDPRSDHVDRRRCFLVLKAAWGGPQSLSALVHLPSERPLVH